MRKILCTLNKKSNFKLQSSPDGGPPSPTASSIHSTTSPNSTQQQQSPPVPRWPLKPGVLVHINRTNSMRSGLSPRLGNCGITTVGLPSPPLSIASSSSRLRLASSTVAVGTMCDSSVAKPFIDQSSSVSTRPFRRTIIKDSESRSRSRQRRPRISDIICNAQNIDQHQQHQDEGVLARANRIRAIFSVQLNNSDAFSGISRGKTGEIFFFEIW